MPVFNFFHWTKEQGYTLEKTGPIIPVEISAPKALQEYLAQNGMDIPPPITGYALIDTGAFATAVDESAFAKLGISPIDVIDTSTPHGPSKSHVYPAQISFPAITLHDIPMERVVGVNLQWDVADDKVVIMLLGRDLLKHFLVIYNGRSSDISLAW